MSTSPISTSLPRALSVSVDEHTLTFHLSDGRSVSAPLDWYPRLVHGTTAERTRWELIGGGESVHWPDLDEDISVANLLNGSRSGESQRSLSKWLAGRS